MVSSSPAGVRSDAPERVSIPKTIIWRDVEGDLVLFDETTREYHTLNRVGSFLWRRIGAGIPLHVIADEAAARFDASEAEIAEHVAAFVADAIARNLLVPEDTTGSE